MDNKSKIGALLYKSFALLTASFDRRLGCLSISCSSTGIKATIVACIISEATVFSSDNEE